MAQELEAKIMAASAPEGTDEDPSCAQQQANAAAEIQPPPTKRIRTGKAQHR